MMPPRAYIFLGLNAVRALSMVALILVFASSILVMVQDIKAYNNFISAKQATSSVDPTSGNVTSTFDTSMLDCDYIEGSTVPNQPAGIFWAVLNRLLIIFQVVALMFSEIGWPDAFFKRFFPVLGSDFGLGALGIFQCLIGAAVLSHHVDDFALVSAFFLFALGCLNIFVGLIFREKAKAGRSITFWRESKKSVLPVVSGPISNMMPGHLDSIRPTFTTQPPSFSSSRFSGHSNEADEKASMESQSRTYEKGYGWGSEGEKAAAKQKMFISKPVEALPPYGMGPRAASSASSRRDEPDFRSGGQAL